MARPKIPAARKRRTVKTLNAETARSTEEVPFGINLIAHHLTEITTKLGMIVDALAFTTSGAAPMQDAGLVDRITRLEGFPTGIESRIVDLEAGVAGAAGASLVEECVTRIAALEARTCACDDTETLAAPGVLPVVKRHRRTKAEMEAARAAEAAAVTAQLHGALTNVAPAQTTTAPPAPKADRATCTHPQTATIPTNPKLSRCLLCGAVIETPVGVQAAQVPAVATPPAPAPTPTAAPAPAATLDDVRGAAITWIGKHGKEKFSALLLEKFGAAQISAVPQAQWGALIAMLSVD